LAPEEFAELVELHVSIMEHMRALPFKKKSDVGMFMTAAMTEVGESKLP
jgi:hypothetical protein